jgi:2C-methyl-D-erythritol 2,4-cyclodiphosphate synthase
MALSDADVLAALKAKRDAVIAQMAATDVGPAFAVDGVSVSSEWSELKAVLDDLDAMIQRYESPVVVYSVGD